MLIFNLFVSFGFNWMFIFYYFTMPITVCTYCILVRMGLDVRSVLTPSCGEGADG